MTLNLVFWVLYLVALLFGGYVQYGNANPRFAQGASLLVFVLLGLLGWAVFGAAIHR